MQYPSLSFRLMPLISGLLSVWSSRYNSAQHLIKLLGLAAREGAGSVSLAALQHVQVWVWVGGKGEGTAVHTPQ